MIETELEKILSNQKKIVEFNLSEIVINLVMKNIITRLFQILKRNKRKNFDAAVNLYSISLLEITKGILAGYLKKRSLKKFMMQLDF